MMIRCLIALVVATAPTQSGPAIWAGLAPGAHGVGFQTAGPAGSVSVWYPAGDGGAAMTLRDYYDEPAASSYAGFLAGAGFRASDVDAMFDAAMAARRNAPRLDGPFPVILIAQGNAQAAADQAVLAEYLASHGYVVATTP
jgi:predicted dienelactone hydrolase